ncbi:MAG: LysE family translocator [Acetobacteraceae bacterium]|nr:LysE family translocator [Acetobacteraceae bacterium]
MDATILSMTGFAVAMYITPGPNNLMLAASAASFGLRATVPHMLGVGVGFTLMLAIVCSGLASVLLAWPLLLPLMRWGGAAWMLLLAWKIATAGPPNENAGRVLGFAGAMAFQWVNPKGWLIALSAAGLFARPDEALWMQGLRIGVVFFAVALPCMAPWMLLGAGARRLLRSPGSLRAFNIAMAVLLVVSVAPVLLD